MVGSEGSSGLNYEHTTAEGPPIAAMMDHILSYWYVSSTLHHPYVKGHVRNPLY